METIFSNVGIIISLIILESLMSIDNALVLAVMVGHLPEKKQKLALRVGLLGAYAFRGITLFFVSFLTTNVWFKVLGGLYLIYLMTLHFLSKEDQKINKEERIKIRNQGFWVTVVTVELADLAFSLDNVVAAVSLSSNFWIIITGVFIGILAMRFVAGMFIKLVKKFPVLKDTAYILIGYIGVQLIMQEITQRELTEIAKFMIIFLIIFISLLYETKIIKNFLKPIIFIGLIYLRLINKLILLPKMMLKKS